MTNSFVRFAGAGASVAMMVTVGCTTNVVQKSGDGGAVAPGAVCAARAGNYVVSAKEKDGTCGPSSDKTFTVEKCLQTFCHAYENGNTAGETTALEGRIPACTGTITVSADNCISEYSYSCPGSGASNVNLVQVIGKITWAADGLSASGTEQDGLFAKGVSLCTSNNAVTITKQ